MPRDPEGDARRDSFLALLKTAGENAHPVRFWWRDDDAETATPALDRLIQLARRHDLPLALAVVPKRATADLAERLVRESGVSVLQHGWSHRNHSPAGEKSMELGDHRPLETVMGELRQGFARLTALLAEKFQPVLVPPWNRISDGVREARREIGLVGFSSFGPAPAGDPHWTNVHLDILAWRPVRRAIDRATAYSILAAELERRLAGDREPIGIMTHHLVHDEASWALLDELFELTAKHASAEWPAVGELFRLERKAPRLL